MKSIEIPSYVETTWIDNKTPVEQFSLNKIEDHLSLLTNAYNANSLALVKLTEQYSALATQQTEISELLNTTSQLVVNIKNTLDTHIEEV